MALETHRQQFTFEQSINYNQEDIGLKNKGMINSLAITNAEEHATSNVLKEDTNESTMSDNTPNRESRFFSSSVGKAQSNLHRLD